MRVVLLAFFALMGLSSCHMATLPPASGYVPPGPFYPPPGHSQVPPPWLSESQGGVHRAGYEFGRSDRYANLDSRPERHRKRVSSRHWSAFVGGYHEGYASVHIARPPRPVTQVHNEVVWRSGFNLGQLDRRRNLSKDYRRYPSRYMASTEASFRDGYLQGWSAR